MYAEKKNRSVKNNIIRIIFIIFLVSSAVGVCTDGIYRVGAWLIPGEEAVIVSTSSHRGHYLRGGSFDTPIYWHKVMILSDKETYMIENAYDPLGEDGDIIMIHRILKCGFSYSGSGLFDRIADVCFVLAGITFTMLAVFNIKTGKREAQLIKTGQFHKKQIDETIHIQVIEITFLCVIALGDVVTLLLLILMFASKRFSMDYFAICIIPLILSVLTGILILIYLISRRIEEKKKQSC